jgi:hypothetical protein
MVATEQLCVILTVLWFINNNWPIKSLACTSYGVAYRIVLYCDVLYCIVMYLFTVYLTTLSIAETTKIIVKHFAMHKNFSKMS